MSTRSGPGNINEASALGRALPASAAILLRCHEGLSVQMRHFDLLVYRDLSVHFTARAFPSFDRAGFLSLSDDSRRQIQALLTRHSRDFPRQYFPAHHSDFGYAAMTCRFADDRTLAFRFNEPREDTGLTESERELWETFYMLRKSGFAVFP